MPLSSVAEISEDEDLQTRWWIPIGTAVVVLLVALSSAKLVGIPLLVLSVWGMWTVAQLLVRRTRPRAAERAVPVGLAFLVALAGFAYGAGSGALGDPTSGPAWNWQPSAGTADTGSKARNLDYELHMVNDADSSVDVRFGWDAAIICRHVLDEGAGRICRITDNEGPHSLFVRAQFPDGRELVERPDVSAQVVLVRVTEFGLQFYEDP